MELGHLGRAPAAFAGDNLECVGFVRIPTDQDRLKDALFRHRLSEILKVLFGHEMARLVGARMEQFDRHCFGGPYPIELCVVLTGLAEQGR